MSSYTYSIIKKIIGDFRSYAGAGKQQLSLWQSIKAKFWVKKNINARAKEDSGGSTSHFMAKLLGENIGETVGYSVRFEHFGGLKLKLKW